MLKIGNSIDNRLCQIYNMGYKEGFADGQREAMKKLADIVLAERKTDEAK